MKVPLDPDGYSVDAETGTIHTRYATHAGLHPRTRTAKGVGSLLGKKRGRLCAECYPSPVYPTVSKAKPPQQRRSGTPDAPPLPGL